MSRRGRKPSYRAGLIDAIRNWFPGQFFSRWRLRKGLWWTPQHIFWMAILMAWSAEQTLQDRFAAVGELLEVLFPQWKLGTSYTGWCDAQAKWIDPLRPALAKRLQRQMKEMAGRCWQREGWLAFAADGSRVECPRTQANETLGCAGKKKTGPQLFLTTLWHMGAGLPWDFRIGPGTASERRHVEEMVPDLPHGALVVADAGFTGYDFYRRLLAARCHFLLRVGANVHLLKKLGHWENEGPTTVYLWPEERHDEQPIVLRLIVLSQGKKKMYLLTDVMDEEKLTKKAAATLYEMRWGIEVFYRSTKQTLQRRKMLSHTPEAAKSELTWALFGIWLLGLMSVKSILARGHDPLSWSVALARSRVRKSMRLALTSRRCRCSLSDQLAQARKDNYERTSSKKARDWPHKKKEKPPGNPKIALANSEQIRAAEVLREKRLAA
jgi:Transposase DDE domain